MSRGMEAYFVRASERVLDIGLAACRPSGALRLQHVSPSEADGDHVQWRRGGRLSPFERMRAHLGPSLDCESDVRRGLTELMSNIFLTPGGRALPRSIVFVPTRATNDAGLVAAVAAEVLAAQVSGPVCLVDADLRTPSLHHQFGIDRAPGVSNLLLNHLAPPRAVPLRGNWSLMPAGTQCLEAVRLLRTDGARRRLGGLIGSFAHTVIHSPSPNGSPDAAMLGSLADGVVLVVNESSTRRDSLSALATYLQSSGAHIVGAVLHAPSNRIFDAVDRWLRPVARVAT
jgi:Mrp family chromosome partitioning ATPase